MTSSSSYARKRYDVFLSFRGETRGSFTDHLYADLKRAGVNTFRDDESIRRGENIAVELSTAIEESRISIIVFSKDYARSIWCLDELVKIKECKQKLNQFVFPIFYDVDPSEVRKQKNTFSDALTLHRERFGDRKVDEWKVALTAAANLSGWDWQARANGYESKFINTITKEVLGVLNFIPMNVTKHPVGIDSRVRDILDLLQTQTNNGVRMIGLFGMGGVGKSTLAKAIYNHLITSFQEFEGSCFIANIRSQVSEGYNGLGTEAIEGMIVYSYKFKDMVLSTKVFTRMVNLRILILDGVPLSGSFKYLSNELRLFRWHNCHLSRIPSDFRFEKLAELDLQCSNIEEFQPSMQNFGCLRILKLDYCERLKKTPDLRNRDGEVRFFPSTNGFPKID